MQVPVASVKQLAKDSGFTDATVAQHLDAFCELVLRARQRERKSCEGKLRKWYFSKEIVKSPLFEVLDD